MHKLSLKVEFKGVLVFSVFYVAAGDTPTPSSCAFHYSPPWDSGGSKPYMLLWFDQDEKMVDLSHHGSLSFWRGLRRCDGLPLHPTPELRHRVAPRTDFILFDAERLYGVSLGVIRIRDRQ